MSFLDDVDDDDDDDDNDDDDDSDPGLVILYADENDIHASLGVSSVADVGGTYYESAIHAPTQGIEKSF